MKKKIVLLFTWIRAQVQSRELLLLYIYIWSVAWEENFKTSSVVEESVINSRIRLYVYLRSAPTLM